MRRGYYQGLGYVHFRETSARDECLKRFSKGWDEPSTRVDLDKVGRGEEIPGMYVDVCYSEMDVVILDALDRDSSVRVNFSGSRREMHALKDSWMVAPRDVGGLMDVVEKFAHMDYGLGGNFK